MANYGLKYFCEFDQLNSTTIRYRLEFLFKDYSGTANRVMASSLPVEHQYQDDSPKAPIKGSNLRIKIINEGWLPITSFYHTDDNGIKVDFYYGSQLMFTGFLVQDDCAELMVDYNHELQLSATDGIGLLKDIPFGTTKILGSNVQYLIYENGTVTKVAPHSIIISGCNYTPIVGTQFEFNGVNYTPNAIIQGSGFVTVTVAETVITESSINGFISVYGIFSYYERNNFLAIFRTCIRNIGLSLPVNVYCSIYELAMKHTNSPLQQIFIDCQTFASKSNYDVLSIILSRFNLTLVQAFGKWHIIHWDEINTSNHAIQYFEYDAEYGILTGSNTLDQNIISGIGMPTILQSGNIKKIYRPFQFSKETFNYKQPINLIVNANLQLLGALVSSIVSGNNTVNTYEFPINNLPNNKIWTHINGDTSKIVVETSNITNTEVARYILQPKITNEQTGYNGFAHFQLNTIEVNQGDRFNFQCAIKCVLGALRNVKYRFGFYLQDTSNRYYALQNSSGAFEWNHLTGPTPQTIGFAHTVGRAESVNYFQYDLSQEGSQKEVPLFPADGLLYIKIFGTNDTNISQPNVSCEIKDINITFDNYITESTRIIGQTHKTEQKNTFINNSDEVEFITDDSPRNTIDGTLFTTNYTNVIQRRAIKWQLGNLLQNKHLGQIITGEIIQWRSIPRSIIDGTFRGLINDDKHISALSVITNEQSEGDVFIFGTLNIDYRNNTFSGTLWSIYKMGEQSADINYNFEYLYKTD